MIDERKQPQDPDVADEPGTQPKKYYKWLSKKDKDARAKHFARGSTKPAPGDKDAKTKPSKHTLKYRKMFLTDSLFSRNCLPECRAQNRLIGNLSFFLWAAT